jgi:hypothetical protein
MDILDFLKLFFKYTPFQQIGWWNVMSLILILIDLMKVKVIWHLFEMFVSLSIKFMHLWKVGTSVLQFFLFEKKLCSQFW